MNCFEYLDVVTLIQKEPVSKYWHHLCIKAIDYKCNKKKKFQSTKELRNMVDKHSPECYSNNYRPSSPMNAEEIASIYGYPINKWIISNINDFSYIFSRNYKFNEPTGS